MPAPTTVHDLVLLLRKSRLIEPARLDAHLTTNPGPYPTPEALCDRLRADGLITPFHADQLLRGKHKGYFLGRYKILDRIGMGGMGQVFLAEHQGMRRRVALKVLPPDRAASAYSRERFMREARAAGQLDHPNLVRAFDVDEEGEVMFLVMEYVEGLSLLELVTRSGPLDPRRAANLLTQAARGLTYLGERGLVHRDVKPSNMMVDRAGTLKILDLGLVRSESETGDLTRGEGVKVLGTADYLAPEQAVDCSRVDIRADIYGLGAAAYFVLTGRPPFVEDTVAKKLIAHQMKPVTPPRQVRPEVPEELSAVVVRMLAKRPADRFQTPDEVLAALGALTNCPPVPPTDHELPASVGATTGTVDLSMPRRPKPSGSSISIGSSMTRTESEPVAAISPAPRPNPTTPPPKPVVPALPVLPVVPIGGPTPPTPPADVAPVEIVRELVAKAEPPAAHGSRRWVTVAVAAALALAIGAWNVATLLGATNR